MIWIAIVLCAFSFIHWTFRQKRDRKGIWLNIGFSGVTLLMSWAVSMNAWHQLQPLHAIYAIFVPASKWLYNLV